MKTQAMNEMLDVAPERHVHIKGNTIYTTVHPAGTADSLRRDYMIARKALDLIVEHDKSGYLTVEDLLDYARQATLQ
jgi:hypothetical protein